MLNIFIKCGVQQCLYPAAQATGSLVFCVFLYLSSFQLFTAVVRVLRSKPSKDTNHRTQSVVSYILHVCLIYTELKKGTRMENSLLPFPLQYLT